MEQDQEKKAKFRWLIPALALALSLAWEGAAFGPKEISPVKAVFAYFSLFMVYNWGMRWLKDKPGQRPPTIELILAIPSFAALLFLTVPPFPYIRRWILTVGLALGAYLFYALSLGFLHQERNKRSGCTARTTAEVTDNIKDRVSRKTGEPSLPTWFPVLAYFVRGERVEQRYANGLPAPMKLGSRVEICYNPQNPREFCFRDAGKDRSAVIIVPFFLVVGTALLAASVLSLVFRWSV